MRMGTVLLNDNRDDAAQLAQENRALRAEIARLRGQVEELERLADTDPLVPLPNRRAFLRELDQMIHRVARYQTPAALLFIDVNGLKAINDRHGHQAGDFVLTHVAQLLKSSLRAADTVARIGGDEFGLILGHVDEAAAQAKAIALVAAVAGAPFSLCGRKMSASVTAGLAMIRAGDSVSAVLDRADAAMYAQRSAR